MASFKLGLIKGEKGDTGAKGEKGDTGATGGVGAIPVFEVDKVETVDPAFGASVEIDSSDIANPKLSFRIPKGVDGKDASGDMISAIYDPEGKKTDVYAFAENLFGNSLPKSGGVVHGKLSVGEAPSEENCVRNIRFSASLPKTAANGDICFVVPRDYDNTIYSQGIGSVLVLKEGDDEEEYVIAAKDYQLDFSIKMPTWDDEFKQVIEKIENM